VEDPHAGEWDVDAAWMPAGAGYHNLSLLISEEKENETSRIEAIAVVTKSVLLSALLQGIRCALHGPHKLF